MKNHDFTDVEIEIARTRVLLSVVSIFSVYVDPTRPILTEWLPLTGGPFMIDLYTLAVMASHLAYSAVVFAVIVYRLAPEARFTAITSWIDVSYGVLIAIFTEGATSPSFVFFAFAILAVGCRGGFRDTLAVTVLGATLYLSLILLSAHGTSDPYIMRPAYLAMTGYLIGHMGQQRMNFEARVRELESRAQRQDIARSLHDGYVQSLAGVNLRLESCRTLLRRGRGEEAFGELTELQAAVGREYDEVRAYIRSLAGIDDRGRSVVGSSDTRFSFKADFRGSGLIVEQVLQIVLEGVRNVRRHARARSAVVHVASDDLGVRIDLDDDGIGFRKDATTPWSIASRVADLGGVVKTDENPRPGAHLRIELPAV